MCIASLYTLRVVIHRVRLGCLVATESPLGNPPLVCSPKYILIVEPPIIFAGRRIQPVLPAVKGSRKLGNIQYWILGNASTLHRLPNRPRIPRPRHLDLVGVSQFSKEDRRSSVIVIFEHHHPFLAIFINPTPEHPSTVKIVHNLPHAIDQLNANDAALSLPSLMPAVSG